ncbi:MAG TPA: type III secretion system stator protein SctL [Acidobacteriota bacterium]
MEQQSKIIKVIKSKDKPPGSIEEDSVVDTLEQKHGLIKGDVYSAGNKAREILQKAQGEAEEIIRRAIEQGEKEKKDGFQEGYQEGLAQVTELLAKARVEYDVIMRNASKDMLELAFKISEKIIGKQLEIDKSTIMDIVAQALQTVRQSKQITIRVNPEDGKALKADKDALIEMLGHGRVIDIMDDKKVEKGGCIIESEVGTVDAQLHKQLERLKKVLTERKVVL